MSFSYFVSLIFINYVINVISFHFAEYYDVVKNSLATYSQDCVTAVQKSIQQVEILLRHMIGQRSLNQKFK